MTTIVMRVARRLTARLARMLSRAGWPRRRPGRRTRSASRCRSAATSRPGDPDRPVGRCKLEHDARHTPGARTAPDDADPVSKMAHRLRTSDGIAAYLQRGHIAESPFGDAKHNKSCTTN